MNIFKKRIKSDRFQMDIIAEIHAEFDTAQDRLLEQAQSIISQERGDIGKLSVDLGFTNTPAAQNHKQIVQTRQEAEIINYYKQNYPFLKFLTMPELDRICNKYGLLYAESSRYIKDVPEKNLKEIANAQPLKRKDQDVTYSSGGGGFSRMQCLIDISVFHQYSPDFDQEKYNNEPVSTTLYICAPEDHFETNGLKKVGFSLVKDDPIVFRKCKGGVQILSKWGLEAEEPELFVDKLN